MKTVWKQNSKAEAMVKAAEREIELLSKLNHQHIVGYLGSHADDQYLYTAHFQNEICVFCIHRSFHGTIR